jgi:ribosomal protein S27E
LSTPTQATQPCSGCGASVAFAPGTTALRCPYCGFEQAIAAPSRAVREHSYDAFLAKPRVRTLAPNQFACPGCQARTESDAISKLCQFCGTALVADTAGDTQIAPEAVLPFALDRGRARESLRGWVKSRWFAPNRLKKVSEAESMKSTYLPHWTFDADTVSDYVGQRGEYYWVTETYTENGQSKTRRVRKTRWHHASGRVARDFDDVLVSATEQVDKERLDKLEPWPLKSAVAFHPNYVTGHHSLRYDTEPQSGLGEAKDRMAKVIETDCRQDIGGDEQRVSSVSTQYSAVTFKLMLLPVWIGCYLFGGNTFQVLINGISGEVHGDRPYSAVKITLAVLAVIALIAAVVWIYMANRTT